MNLGIVYKDKLVVNHRSFIKVIFNPMFRYFGFHIVTKMKDKYTIAGVKLDKCEKVRPIKWDFKNFNDSDSIEKRRRFI